MKKALSTTCDVVIYIIIFLVIQTVCYGLISLATTQSGAVAIGTAISSILTVLLFQFSGISRMGTLKTVRHPWQLLITIGLLAFFLIPASTWLTEQAGFDMPEEGAEMFEQMMRHPLGFLSVCILVPIAEEYVFRGAVLGRLLKQFNERPWIAIVLSALAFALIHGNMAQAPHAFVIGVLLGWICWRTGSLIPGILFHVVNNTLSFLATKMAGDDIDARLIDLYGGNETMMYSSIAVCTLLALFCLYNMWKQLRDNDTERTEDRCSK